MKISFVEFCIFSPLWAGVADIHQYAILYEKRVLPVNLRSKKETHGMRTYGLNLGPEAGMGC